MKILNIINNGFDYMYYRIWKAYHKSDGTSGVTALFGISLFQNFLLLVPISKIIRNVYGSTLFHENKPILSAIFILIQFAFLIRAYLRYRNIEKKLEEKWGNEKEPNKSINGTLVVLALLLPFVLLVII